MHSSTKNLLESNFATFTSIGADYIPHGVVLGEFATLPKPSPSFGAGIVAPPPSEAGPLSESGWGVTTTEAGSSSGTEVVGVENITAGKGVTETGPLVSTVCDKDGDGYDGPWTTDISMKNKPVSPDSSAVWMIDTDKNKCIKPGSPFDCDDENTKVSPGAVEVCANGIDDNCNGDVDEVGCVPQTKTEAPDITKDPRTADRFMCFEEQRSKFDEGGTFAECCGFDLGWCLNSIPKARRQGSVIKTLREFSSFGYATSEQGKNCANTTNCALRYGVAIPAKEESDSAEYAIPLFIDNSDAKIRDWSSYKYLEFYVHFTGNFIGNIKVGKFTHPEIGETAKSKPFAYDYYINEPIIKYVVNEPQLKKWLRVVIPLEKFPPIDQADVVVIASPVKLLKQAANKITYLTLDGKTNTVRTLISIDKIALVGAKGNRYCTGTYPPKWTSDLDDLGQKPDEPMNILEVPGLAACEDTPGFGWTGSQCCGDDTGKESSSTNFGDSTFKEFFSDTNGGCWAGQKIGFDQRLMMIKYRLFIPGFGEKKVTRSCKSNSCIYELPFMNNTLVMNDYTNAYDLVLLEDKRIDVAPLAITTSPSAALKAENVPLQVLYAKSGTSADFYGCNAEPYIFDVKSSVTGKPLLVVDAEHNLSSCAIKSEFFCSHAFGNDLGWSNEPLTNYSSYPALNVTATARSNEKVSYNLIRNSGFEEV
ncbi:putative metal-binding motif-containing protein [Candidatus Woesearchaeota archaeon]|nr:putative metal-binding motif-containing protein [Candidatus Woesearchaeota archaeon]